MDIQIEKGIPMPEKRKLGRVNKYAALMPSMGVGDSIVVAKKELASLKRAMREAFGLRCSFIQTFDDGETFRVWRTK